MVTYCYRCPKCGRQSEAYSRDEDLVCGPCLVNSGRDEAETSVVVYLNRDYQAESVGIAMAQLKREREHSKEEYMAKFLPSNKDFAGPNDPDGKKGMRQWREEHNPKSDNKKPWWPGEV